MAIRCDASADYLSRTANLPASTAFTIAGWFRRRGAGGAAVEVLSGISRADLSSYYLAYVSGGTLYVEVNGAYTAAGAFSSDVWHFVALSSNGSGAGAAKIRRADVGATSLATTTRAGASFVPQLMVLCGVGDPNYYGNFAVAGVKVWDRELSDSELLSEMHRLTPASTTNLNLWTPMVHNSVANAVKDFSGNGRDWTANGSLTIEDGPPIGWGGSIIVPQYAAAGGDASAALGGSAASATAGSATAARSVAPLGAAVTASAGTLSPQASYSAAITGEQVAASAGTLTPSVGTSAALTGEQVSASAGTAVPASAVAVTGSQVSASARTVAPGASAALSGTQVAASAGTVSVGAAAALTGGAATASAGTAAPQASVAVTGASSTVAAGTLTASAGSSVSVALTGASATASAGLLSVNLSVAAQGSEATASAGTITASSEVSVALSGASVAASAGMVGGRTDLGLTGIEVSGLVGSLQTSGGTVVVEAGAGSGGWLFTDWQRVKWGRKRKAPEKRAARALVAELEKERSREPQDPIDARLIAERITQLEAQIAERFAEVAQRIEEQNALEATKRRQERNRKAIEAFLRMV